MTDQVTILVGTKKGAFIYTSDSRRGKWEISDPILPGWTFYHLSADTRCDPPRLYAAANHWAWGRSVAKSTDLGETWDYRSENLAFPPDMRSPNPGPGPGGTPGEWQSTPPGVIGNVWNVTPGHESEPGVVFAGLTATRTAGTGRAPAAGTPASTPYTCTRPTPGASFSASARAGLTNRRTAARRGSCSLTTRS
ncbi:MAG: hypothetical protein Q7T33_04185 [Dehalococcoidia bacterium]|nr:hypothetical protein [Dehalococcoidia bacterium]